MSNRARIVFTTYETREQALTSIKSLLDKKLMACAQLIDIESIYTWQGDRQQDKEVLALLKTTAEAYPRLAEELSANHPYEVPEIISVASDDAAEAYLQWMEQAVR